jgi:hypothetical protein
VSSPQHSQAASSIIRFREIDTQNSGSLVRDIAAQSKAPFLVGVKCSPGMNWDRLFGEETSVVNLQRCLIAFDASHTGN